jgi:hypothetical protein
VTPRTSCPRSAEYARLLEGGAQHLLSADVPDFGQDDDALQTS